MLIKNTKGYTKTNVYNHILYMTLQEYEKSCEYMKSLYNDPNINSYTRDHSYSFITYKNGKLIGISIWYELNKKYNIAQEKNIKGNILLRIK